MAEDARRKALGKLNSAAWTLYKCGFGDRFVDPVEHAADVLRTELDEWGYMQGGMLCGRDGVSDRSQAEAVRAELLDAAGMLSGMDDLNNADRCAIDRAEAAAFRLELEYLSAV